MKIAVDVKAVVINVAHKIVSHYETEIIARDLVVKRERLRPASLFGKRYGNVVINVRREESVENVYRPNRRDYQQKLYRPSHIQRNGIAFQ